MPSRVSARRHRPGVGALVGAAFAVVAFSVNAADQPSTRTPRRLAALGKSRTQSETPSGRISPAAFLSSPFARFFKAEDYPGALQALEVLATDYPNDPLIIRYRAMVLDRLGRSDEAITLFRELLAREPTHTPTHLFLAQAYDHAGNAEEAANEWRWVIANSPSEEYRQLAQEALHERATHVTRPAERERFYLLGDVGFEYDSNPRLKPSDTGVAISGNEQQAERASFNLGLGYRAVTRPDARVDVVYTTRQSLHDRGLDDVNFTSQEAAVDARKLVSLWDRDVTFGSRYEFIVGFLDGELFSLSNRLLLTCDARATAHTRTTLTNRFTVSNFGPDGSNPPQTSRDGFYYDLGVTQYFYSEDFLRYLYVSQELDVAQTRGANFTRRGTTSRIGVHTPLPVLARAELDVSGGFRFGHYPRFTSLSALDPDRREDTVWDLLTALTYSWTPRLATRVSYRFINANNRNDLFQYDRHLAGIQLLFKQSF